jgi:hypothetical protein
MKQKIAFAAASLVALGLLCSAGAQAKIAANGISLNGISLNGISLNGMSPNTANLNALTIKPTSAQATQSEQANSGAVSAVIDIVLPDGEVVSREPAR